MNHVFISYSRKDEEVVSWFAEELKSQGIEVWQDISGKDSGIPCSSKWFAVIEQALYDASAALVFTSDASERSAVCSEERDIIKKNLIPCRSVWVKDLTEDGKKNIVFEISEWLKETLENSDNKVRILLLSGGYRLKQRGKVVAVPRTKGILSIFHTVRELKNYWNYLEMSGLKEQNPDIYPFVCSFIKKTRKKIFLRQGRKVAIAILAFFAYLAVRALPEAMDMAMEMQNATMSAQAGLDMIRDVSEYDPVAAAALLTSEKFQLEYVANDMFRTMLFALEKNIPSDFYEGKPKNFQNIKDAQKPKWDIRLSEDTGKIKIINKEEGYEQQLLLDTIPVDYDIDETGEFLAVAASNKAYVYDLEIGNALFDLDYNFEEIQEIGFTETGSIAAVMDGGDMVEWENPLQGTVLERNLLIEGKIDVIDGKTHAVYIDKNGIAVINDTEKRRYEVFSEYEIVPKKLAVTTDFSKGAVLCMAGDNQVLLLCNLNTGEIVSMTPESNLTSIIFSADGEKIICGSEKNYALAEIDLATGKTKYSAEGNAYPYVLQRYKNGYICGDTIVTATVYDSDLKVVKTGIPCNVYSNPAKELVVSEIGGFLFVSERGGNISSMRTSLSDGTYQYRLSMRDSDFISNTTVAISDDGKYVVYGIADGSVQIFDTEKLYPLWIAKNIGESISSIAFSEDNAYLSVLGKSGNIYKLELPDVLEKESAEEIWQTFHKMAYERYLKMSELGLTYITPDGYYWDKSKGN